MILTQAHIDALRSQQRDQFIEDMVIFFQKTDPFHSKALGIAGLRRAIVTGVRLAGRDGITEQDPVRVYLQLMVFLGGRFSQDPHMPWARHILDAEQQFRSQAERMSELRRCALTHLRVTCGANGLPLRNFINACSALKTDNGADLNKADLAKFIKANYPLKSDHLGDRALAHLIHDSAAQCAKAGMGTQASVTYLTLMRFVYGYWIADDPLFPWVYKMLREPSTTHDPDALFEHQATRFFDRVQTYITEKEKQNGG